MKKQLLNIVLLLTLNAQAQNFWSEQTFSPLYNNIPVTIKGISIVDQNSTWLNLTSGSPGIQLRPFFSMTNDGGNTWTSGTIVLNPTYNGEQIANICGTSSSTAFVAVYPTWSNGVKGIWKTQDGGTNWTRQNTASFSEPESFPDLVYFWNDNEGVSVGNPINGYFEIYTTSNGGDLWTRITPSASIASLGSSTNVEYLIPNNFEVNGNTIWVGTGYGRILKSSDKGYTWTIHQSPINDFGVGINDPELGSLAFTDLSNGLLQTSDNLLYKTSDGGQTWTPVSYSGDMRNFDIAAVPGISDTYISIGETTTNSSELGSSYSVDGGNTWISINNNPDTNFVDGRVVAMLNENYGFAAGFTKNPLYDKGIFKWTGGALLRQAHLSGNQFNKKTVIDVWPNPSHDLLNIQAKAMTHYEVTDLTGKIILSATFKAVDNLILNLESLVIGVYLLKIANSEGISTKKIMRK